MAVVRNKTPDDLSLLNGASVKADAELDVPDETFVDRAWPKSTWAIVKKPGKDFVDASTDDAYLFVGKSDETVDELKARAASEGVDITGLTKKDEIVAALAAGPTTPEESA